ncbi:Glucoamylase, intracellular sporulation-specific [Chytridiales sp. JEL 0842]|nr:Glucoamylase, intracellular sporulation-specific [Chytridiales sp. JEL 0842]
MATTPTATSASGGTPPIPSVSVGSTPVTPILVRISVPSIGVQKTLRASPLDTVWSLKQQILDKVATEIRDHLNFGIFLQGTGGKVGKFLDEKRDLASYQLENNCTMEFIPKKRVTLTAPDGDAAATPKNQKKFTEDIAKGNIDKVKERLAKGMDPNFIMESGETPLIMSILNNDREMIMTLIENGAILDYRAGEKDTWKTPLHILLNHGAWVNSLDGSNLTPLQYAASAGHSDCVEKLIALKPDLEVQDQSGKTPLHQACLNNHVFVVALLADFGANLDAVNVAGNTPLHIAATRNAVECAKWLCMRGCDREKANKTGQNPMQVAVMSGSEDIVELLKKFTPDQIIPPPPKNELPPKEGPKLIPSTNLNNRHASIKSAMDFQLSQSRSHSELRSSQVNRAAGMSVGNLAADSRLRQSNMELEPPSDGLRPSTSMQSLTNVAKGPVPGRTVFKIPGPPPGSRPADPQLLQLRTTDIKLDTPSTMSPGSLLSTTVESPERDDLPSPTADLSSALQNLRAMIESKMDAGSLLSALDDVTQRMGSVETEVQRLSRELIEIHIVFNSDAIQESAQTWALAHTLMKEDLSERQRENQYDPSIDEFLEAQSKESLKRMLRNIHPDGTIRGIVAASPSRREPDYFYHWVRDAALVMSTVVELYERSIKRNSSDSLFYESLLWDYAILEARNQQQETLSGLGEPKFNVNGEPYMLDWGRPQNDGPALRSTTLMKFAEVYMDVKGGAAEKVREYLYRPELPARSPIKIDLEYVAHSWRNPSVELWEEVRGHTLHTRAVQLGSLVAGDRFARRMGDPHAARYYSEQAKKLQTIINQEHWDERKGYLLATIGMISGPPEKTSNLDVSTVLGALHARQIRSNYTLHTLETTSGRLLRTAIKVAREMKKAYTINEIAHTPEGWPIGPGIGRYTEDVYDGYRRGYGNPWFLATNALAELCFDVASKWWKAGKIQMTRDLAEALEDILSGGLLGLESVERSRTSGFARLPVSTGKTLTCTEHTSYFLAIIGNITIAGDAYIRRVRRHVPQEAGDTHEIGAMSEQFNRWNGFMQGATELGWSHASVLTAKWAREEMLASFSR